VAGDAARLAAVAGRLLLLPSLARRWDVGGHPLGHPRASAPPARAGGDAERGDRGQPVGQDDAKGGPRGHDEHKNAGGRERHLSVDTQGFLLTVVVAAADVRDRDGGRLLAHAPRTFGPDPPRRALVWADAAYAGARVEEPREQRGWTPEIVKRSEGPPKRPGFQVQPHRWVVERTFGWFGGSRRLSEDDEYELESSEAMIYAAMGRLMRRRIGRRTQPLSSPAG
jgi:transposase